MTQEHYRIILFVCKELLRENFFRFMESTSPAPLAKFAAFIFGRSFWTAERLSAETQISSSLCSVVEVIKQIEPGSVMPTAKPRLQSEVYPPKSCNSNREEGDTVTGY